MVLPLWPTIANENGIAAALRDETRDPGHHAGLDGWISDAAAGDRAGLVLRAGGSFAVHGAPRRPDALTSCRPKRPVYSPGHCAVSLCCRLASAAHRFSKER